MQIVHVVLGKANPARMNGVNRVVHDLATQQVAAGEQVLLWGITRFTHHDYPPRTYPTRLFRACGNPFRLDPQLIAALDSLDTDAIVHLHGGFIPTFYALGKALRQRSISYVLTAHGSYNTIAMRKSRWRKKLYFRLFENQLLRHAQAIHCLGKSETAGLQGIYPNHKTVLIPYGFSSPAGVRACPLPGLFIIGFCGRLDVYTKGLDMLLTAFALFSRVVPQARLWIIGGGKGRQQLESLARQLDMLPKITFFGVRFGQEKLALLAQLQVFAHPSRNEGLPTAVLEAASLGLPCVVTDATNMGEAIREYHCGEVIPEAEDLQLYKALMRQYQDIAIHGADRFAANARRMVKEAFDWQQIVHHLHAQLYTRA